MPMPLTIFLDRRDDLLEQLVALSRDILNLWLPTTSPGVAVGGLCLTRPYAAMAMPVISCQIWNR
jgi:hypothetical protein